MNEYVLERKVVMTEYFVFHSEKDLTVKEILDEAQGEEWTECDRDNIDGTLEITKNGRDIYD